MEITLTAGQQDALNMLTDWVNDPDQQFAILKGYAGTGKTTVLNQFGQNLRNTNIQSIVFVALSNKATNVLSAMAKGWGLNVPCMTVCKLLGLRPKVINEKTGEQKFVPEHGEVPKFNDYQLVVVDECSMIGAELFEHIWNAAIESDMFHRTKVLFVGDPAQLPPVNERSSPSFDVPNAPMVELTEVVRYDGSIAVLAEDVRLNPRRVEFPAIEHDHTPDKAQGIFAYADESKWTRQLVRAFTSDNAKADPDYVRVLAYRNARVKELNSLIRRAIYGDNCPDHFDGQRLIAQDPLMDGNKIMIPTSAEFRVIKATESEIRCRGEYWQGWELSTSFDGELMRLRVLKAEETARYNAAMNGLKRDKRWHEFYQLKQFWHNVRDCYALTVHKSQGSTFENVFLDMPDLKVCKSAKERNALLYVALTRTSKRLFVLKGAC